ncbi:aspartate kinase [Microvirga sp. STS02]|uniref:aspartate kinase n=1 Tax=Hymenobacter negativus TaxID=2795026 RepID=UPI0018DB2CE5|nr:MULTISPECIES: aspartate kinase [Bacteria]MBH8569032.1 aspartate kinase [Hymenobacter negativus]MBR7208767.1 aspartate kinase [Microvirga sp. STS02]
MEKVQGLQVYKFGGASVKDAAAILNLRKIVGSHSGPLVIVVSAMGKTTNALEEIFDLAYHGKDYADALNRVEDFHRNTAASLAAGAGPYMMDDINEGFRDAFDALEAQLAVVSTLKDYDEQYDQVVSYGELLASEFVAHVLNDLRHTRWLDCRSLLRTNESWREAQVDWQATEENLRDKVLPCFQQVRTIVTQGFIGGTADGRTTTLGREGSDYTAAIMAYCLRAESVTIWKDVAGLLNADPKIFPDTVRYPEISYRETIEMAYYGASVIHPKTLKPLADRNIPLRVKSFLDPEAEGTLIHDCQHPALAPAFIRKSDQVLLSFASKDFSFISEENMAVIFAGLAQAKLKINVMQNSAISFSVCVDYSERRVHQLLDLLREQFTLHYNTGLTLFTIKNYDAASIARLTAGKRLLLEQRTRHTFQFVCQD